ncbi:hypothetical protein ncot_16655 [Nocardioides sp. JQ2195]|uniref:hypothetical protein n=1 Tax=Nocardioides sp. JQ2195 TaxID=2592334 RepID=UPI00143EEB78|nr:hypothetical protein [Nocardioides sp. JQ2195]QIX28039.1 hypothetical protein ncot_16655 [Nocardioides sp. JQ2195]
MAANPGFAQQGTLRTVFRVVGVLALLGFVLLLVLFAKDVASTMGDESFVPETPNFMLFFAALPLLIVAGVCLNAGFGGAAARYAAGEVMPVAKDSLEYLTDGQGVGHLGRTPGAPPEDHAGPSCSRCGVRNDAEATFCDACGDRLA